MAAELDHRAKPITIILSYNYRVVIYHCAIHVRKYQANKSVITLCYQQKDIDSGGGVHGGYPPKNMTMQIIDGNWKGDRMGLVICNRNL